MQSLKPCIHIPSMSLTLCHERGGQATSRRGARCSLALYQHTVLHLQAQHTPHEHPHQQPHQPCHWPTHPCYKPACSSKAAACSGRARPKPGGRKRDDKRARSCCNSGGQVGHTSLAVCGGPMNRAPAHRPDLCTCAQSPGCTRKSAPVAPPPSPMPRRACSAASRTCPWCCLQGCPSCPTPTSHTHPAPGGP